MRILHITKKYPDAIGGDAQVVHSLELQQENAGIDVVILTANTREVRKKRNVRVFGILDSAAHLDRVTPKRLLSLVCFLFSSVRALAAERPDIVHTHSADLGFLVSFPARLLGIPVIQTCHGICFNDKGFSSLKRAVEAFLLKYGLFECITTVDGSSIPAFSRLGISCVKYVPNGVDSTLFKVQRNAQARPLMRFLCVGRLEHQKGLDILIEAASALREVTNDFCINIVGNGSLREDLARQIAAGSLDVYVQLLGSVSGEELVRQYASSDAFVLPSRWEGMPLTLLEAWAAGLPVIVTEVGGITQICRDNENALVIKPGDSLQLFRAMRRLMDHPDLGKRLGSEGNRIARERYSWDRIADTYHSLYLEAIQSRCQRK
jgi:glycosyltransferase involved in cell wall biosynthesis